MIPASRLRTILRWAHIVEAGVLMAYLYSPLGNNPVMGDAVRYVVVPLMGLSGIWMWQQGRVARLLRGAKAAPVQMPASQR